MIVLVGFLGAGKTTVGRALADRTGLGFVDTDVLIEQEAGATVSEIFEREGEAGFRARETAVARRVLTGAPDAIVALGGGAPAQEEVQAALGRGGTTVVHLDVSLDEARRRMGDDLSRPMLRAGNVDELFETRRRIYDKVAGLTIAVNGRAAEDVAAEIARTSGYAFSVEVPVPGAPYGVHVGEGIAAQAASFVPKLERAEQALVIGHDHLVALADPVIESFRGAGVAVTTASVPEGEGAKSLDAAARLWDRCAEVALHRGDVVVGVGGGVITDLAGFVASTFNRGLAVLHVPTTLLAQVDAAIGGKTGINLPQGKNLVGTFHQPVAVVCDVEMLRTLPVEEVRAGLAEVVKYGFIAHADMLPELIAGAEQLLARDSARLAWAVRRSAAAKAAIVAADERERGRRAVLNYGHTFAHAMETLAGYGEWRHGEAVAVGMMAAAHLARELGRIDEDAVALHRRVLEAVGLPVHADLELGALEEAWKRDKKYERGVRFVLLAGIGRAEAGIVAPREAVAAALERLKR